MGRRSIFVVNTIMFIGCFQLMIIYFMVIGDILASFASEILSTPDSFWASRQFYILLLALALTPIVFKRQIYELKIASFLLFMAIILFEVVLIWQLAGSGADQNPD